jgi:hypothetical protein
MEAQNGSAATGTGLIDKRTGSFTITIKLTGLAPSSSHISHIHAGKCSQPGGIAFALSQVIADSSGAATATTVVPVDYSFWLVRQRPSRTRLHRGRLRPE